MPSTGRRPLMMEVAKLASVSQATVSYVINGLSTAQRIPPETQKRVWQACRKLNYEPDYLATSMAIRKTGVVGLLFPNVGNYFVADIIRGLQEVVRGHRRQVALCLGVTRIVFFILSCLKIWAAWDPIRLLSTWIQSAFTPAGAESRKTHGFPDSNT